MFSICGVIRLKVETQIKMKLKWFITLWFNSLNVMKLGVRKKNFNIFEAIIEGGSY
jgi:hypothetical protein